MELSNSIKNRRSIRKYKEDKIDKKIIEDIIYYGTLAPSGYNRQPWYFVIIEDIELKAKIGDLVEEKNPDYGFKTANAIKQAPILVMIYDRFEYENNDETLFDILSIGACTQNMCLKSLEYELGTLWIGLICNAEEEINNLVNVDKKLVGALSIGKPLEEPNPRPREDLNNLVEWK